MRLIIFLFVALLTCHSYAFNVKKVDVFYVGNEPTSQAVKGAVVGYYDLSSAKNIQKSLSLKLPNNLKDATSYMGDFASSNKGQEVLKNIVAGYQGVGKSFSLGVKELPAIVINERYVVYGTTDISVALDFHKKFKKAEK